MVPLKIWKATVVLGIAKQTVSHKAPSLGCEMQILITLSVLNWAFSVACISRTQKYLYSIHFCHTFHPTESWSASQTEISSMISGDGFTQHRNAAAAELHVAMPQTFVWQGLAPCKLCAMGTQGDQPKCHCWGWDLVPAHRERAEQHCCLNVLQASLKFCR